MQEIESVKANEQMMSDAIKDLIQKMAKVLSDVFDQIRSMMKSLAEKFIESLERVEADRQKSKRHKLDFTRPMIRHQVLDRRPRLIKKVIH